MHEKRENRVPGASLPSLTSSFLVRNGGRGKKVATEFRVKEQWMGPVLFLLLFSNKEFYFSFLEGN